MPQALRTERVFRTVSGIVWYTAVKRTVGDGGSYDKPLNSFGPLNAKLHPELFVPIYV